MYYLLCGSKYIYNFGKQEVTVMKFRNWFEAVMTTTTAPPKPPEVDDPKNDDDDGNYDHFEEAFYKWTKANGPCFKSLVSLTNKAIEENLVLVKTNDRTAPFGGFADVYFEAKGILISVLESIRKAVLGNCDLWKALGIDYTKAANLFMKHSFQQWFGNNILTAIFGNPMFIGDNGENHSMANFMVWDYFKKHPERKRELGVKIRKEQPKADLVLSDVYGDFRLKWPDVGLVGYLSVRAAVGMMGSGDNLFDGWVGKESDGKEWGSSKGVSLGEMDVYNRQKGKLGYITFSVRENILRPNGGFRLTGPLFTETMEVLAWWAKEKGYGFAPPEFNTDKEYWPMIKKFFERWKS